jgi:hypothetical protein
MHAPLVLRPSAARAFNASLNRAFALAALFAMACASPSLADTINFPSSATASYNPRGISVSRRNRRFTQR